MINPLYEILQRKIFHKGQFKENQYALKQLRKDLSNLKFKLKRLLEEKEILEKKIQNEISVSKLRLLNYKLNSVIKVIENTKRLTETKKIQIETRSKTLLRMAKTNTKALSGDLL